MQTSEKLNEIKDLFQASALTSSSDKVTSGISKLDHFLKGGLPVGLCEWGIPPGCAEREVFLRFVAATRALTLWVYTPSLRVYPPAWAAQGVDLSLVRFVSCSTPMQTLKPLFMSSAFKLLFFDAPEKLSVADCAFLAHRARLQKQSIILIRNYRLSNKRGNIWANLRLNCTRTQNGDLEFTGLRGTQIGKCVLNPRRLLSTGG